MTGRTTCFPSFRSYYVSQLKEVIPIKLKFSGHEAYSGGFQAPGDVSRMRYSVAPYWPLRHRHKLSARVFGHNTHPRSLRAPQQTGALRRHCRTTLRVTCNVTFGACQR